MWHHQWFGVAQGQEELQVPGPFRDYLWHRVIGLCSWKSCENTVLLSPFGGWIWESACSGALGHIQSLTSDGASRDMLGSLPAATNGSSLPLSSEVVYSPNPTAC